MRIPKTRIIVDRFLRALSLRGHHIDITYTKLSNLMGFYMKGSGRDIDTSEASLSMRIQDSLTHIDFDKSEISRVHSALFESFTSVDEDRSSARGIVARNIIPIAHVDVDRSSVKTMQVRPMFLGTLSTYSLGELSAMEMGEMNYEQV